MMRPGPLTVVIVLTLGLTGCVGLGKSAAQKLFGKKETTPTEKITAAQEEAISLVHGGSPGTPIMWTDATSGIRGALVPDSGADVPNGCRQYQQTVILAGETLQGQIVACSQKDGSWKLFGGIVGGSRQSRQ